MSDKEHISTLITTGGGLPPVNPYLDDHPDPNDDDTDVTHGKKKGKTPAIPLKPAPKNNPIVPDPKEYIAELERPEGDLF